MQENINNIEGNILRTLLAFSEETCSFEYVFRFVKGQLETHPVLQGVDIDFWLLNKTTQTFRAPVDVLLLSDRLSLNQLNEHFVPLTYQYDNSSQALNFLIEQIDGEIHGLSLYELSITQMENILPFLKQFIQIYRLLLIKHQAEALRVSNHKYKKLINASSEAIFVHDLEGKFIEVNDAACRSIGYLREELVDHYVWELEMGPPPNVLQTMWSELQKGPMTQPGFHKRKDGTSFPIEARLTSYHDEDDALVFVVVKDMSHQKQSANTIHKLTRALEQSPILVMITDEDGKLEYVNQKVMDKTGFSTKEILGKNPRMFQSGLTPKSTYKTMWEQLKNNEEWRGELLNRKKNEELFWVSAIISPLIDENNTLHYLSVMEDITQKKSYEEMLKHQATYDSLTNLPNRAYAFNRLEHALAKARTQEKQLAVLYLDLDGFKQINDTLGHGAGDALLISVANRYLSIIRNTDTVARLGGDEFMIMLENVRTVADAERIAKKCIAGFQKTFLIDQNDLHVTPSIGIAIFPDHARDARTLMRHADTAMYQSKLRGGNSYTIFEETMAEVAVNRMQLRNQLFQALAQKELDLSYQPIFSTQSNKIVGAEALLRWYNPKLGLIMPEQIIPIAEDSGIIIALGYWVLETVCRQIKTWQIEHGMQLKISVNISTLQLKQKDFVQKVKEYLEHNDIDSGSLSFEITESIFIDDSDFILQQLKELSKLGIESVLDDFGMGYSSLNYLRSFPFTALKIDRVFVQGIQTKGEEKNLVNSIVTLSKNLNMAVIAEGVETAEQLKYMKKLQCDYIQGFYFSKPLKSEDFLAFWYKHQSQ